ncbi:MAG: heavy metal-responsive transcriptional regulator [Bacteroidetes bacterium]|nr:heavy metal-responsive transcriptional regulator [Bacteroidota bacterium]MBU2584257.1 heavy metal-responsive transcriptional regulator [Bacteroidota bacterium]
MAEYFVGQLAEEVGINTETVRYYEKLKLLPKPKRKESRYRIYDETDLKRLLFVKRAKELGFTLKEIKELFGLRRDSEAKCGDVKHLTEHKLQDVDNRIRDLKNIRSVLVKLINQCVNEEVSSDECPILEVIEIT